MKISYFETWDWNLDQGDSPIDKTDCLPKSHAKVFVDWRELPYRVVVNNPSAIRSLNSPQDELFIYDYFYDDAGKVVEKRALDEAGDVLMIVRYEYEGERKVSEIGWSTKSNAPPKRILC